MRFYPLHKKKKDEDKESDLVFADMTTSFNLSLKLEVN